MADTQTPPPSDRQPTMVKIEDEMRQAYLDYAMSVIIGRALPDVRDGLKPVHRRVLFAMHELSNSFNRPYKKSARIVGDVIGKYHPHGDQAVYDTLVRMAQDFSMRHVLVDGQGNFGSIDGDPPAAMRYTEVRMSKMAGEMLVDIEKETVDYGPNYDESLSEPLVLPSRVPNLLVNGSSGIAVGMATNIPPHNLGEVVDATCALARDPGMTIPQLMELVPAPDFPTSGILYGEKGLRDAYTTGRGVIKLRGRAEIEEGKRTDRIIITEIPFQVNKSSLIEKIADLVRDKRIEDISDVRDESNRDGIRVVIELKRDANAEVILNQLYANTALQSSFGFNMLAIVHGQPKLLSLRELLQHFIDHRRDVVTRRSRFELAEARRRFNVVFGLLAAIDSIDRVISIIRHSEDTPAAKLALMNEALPVSDSFRQLCDRVLTFSYEDGERALKDGVVKLNEAQAQSILEMRLSRLTGLERNKLSEEAEGLRDVIQELTEILESPTRLLEVVIEELEEIKAQYANPRKTEVQADVRTMSAEDLIVDEEMVVTLSHAGYVKRAPLDTYRAQRRGGRGKTGATTRDEDFLERMFVASTHSYVLVFTDLGKVYWLKVHEIPQAGRTARGKPIINLLKVSKGERIAAVLPVREFIEGAYLVMVTAQGYVKKTDLLEFSHPRPSGLRALSIGDGDALIRVGLTDGDQDLLVATRMGQAIRFSESDVRAMGRTARGVTAIRLKKAGDAVVGMVILNDEVSELLTVSDLGYGKRTAIDEYRVQGRGGTGIINCKLTDRNGSVTALIGVGKEDEVMLVTDRGMMLRLKASQISQQGRATQGVRIMSLGSGENVASVARVADKDD